MVGLDSAGKVRVSFSFSFRVGAEVWSVEDESVASG